MTAPHAPKSLPRGTADGTLRRAFPARDTAATIRGVLYGTTHHEMRDTPLPRLARMTGEFCRQACSPSVAGRARRLEGGGR